jgi:hypothetical protein
MLALGACSADKPATITVVPSETFQTMDAWEATAKMWEFDKRGNRFDSSWMPARDRILATMIEEGGINRLRLELRSGAENPVDYWSQFRAGKLSYTDFRNHYYEKINDNADSRALNPRGVQFSELDFRVENFILPALRIAKQMGRPMTFTLCYVDFGWTTRKGSLSHAANPEEYAELIAAAYSHLRQKYALEPAALEIILEPDNGDGWDGKRIGGAIVAVSKRLEAQGIRPRIIAPSTSVARKMPRYFDQLSSIPGAAQKIAVLSYHRYGKPPAPEVAEAIRARAKRIGAQTAMLEYTRGDADDLFDDLIEANVSSWQKYSIATLDLGNAMNPQGNMLRVSHLDRAIPEVETLPESTALAALFRAVDPGAVRIGTRSDQPWAEAVAFRNPDGHLAVSIKAELGPVMKLLQKVHKRINTPLPQPGGGAWVRLRGVGAGQYRMQRSNALVGRILRCTVVVEQDGKGARVFLREGDVATLAELPKGGRQQHYPGCSHNPDQWR